VALVGGIADAVAGLVVLRRVPVRLVLYVTVWLFALSTADGAIAPPAAGDRESAAGRHDPLNASQAWSMPFGLTRHSRPAQPRLGSRGH
jgi:hypothetical protein